MLILVRKLYERYHRFTDISAVIGENTIVRLNRGQTVEFWNICKKLDLNDIGYTYEDFLVDYSKHVERYKEKELVYKIWSQGHSIYMYEIEKGITTNGLYRALKGGITARHKKILSAIWDILDLDFDTADLVQFDVTVYDSYCKLIGDREALEAFRVKYQIHYPVLPYKGLFHLAFDGWVFLRIKNGIR